jgi:hypothetical protein
MAACRPQDSSSTFGHLHSVKGHKAAHMAAQRQGTGYSRTHSTLATTSCSSNAAEDHALSIIHIRCRLHPCRSATKSYAHPSPGNRSRLPLSLPFVCFELPLSFQFVRSLSTITTCITASNFATLSVNAHDRFLHCLNDKVLASRDGSTFDASEARPHMPCIKHCAIFLSPQCRRLRSTGFGRITAARFYLHELNFQFLHIY